MALLISALCHLSGGGAYVHPIICLVGGGQMSSHANFHRGGGKCPRGQMSYNRPPTKVKGWKFQVSLLKVSSNKFWSLRHYQAPSSYPMRKKGVFIKATLAILKAFKGHFSKNKEGQMSTLAIPLGGKYAIFHGRANVREGFCPYTV